MLNSNSYNFDKKLTPCNDIVVLRKLEEYPERKKGEIFLSRKVDAGYRLTKATVEDIGPDAKDKGIKKGDTVLYDTYAVYYPTYPICWTNFENIIALDDESTKEKFKPFGDYILLQFDKVEDSKQGDIILTGASRKLNNFARVLNLGNKVTRDDITIGSNVMFTSAVTEIVFQYGNEDYFLVKQENIVAINEDD
jgi:co-chaperonin GroES (HSP10)